MFDYAEHVDDASNVACGERAGGSKGWEHGQKGGRKERNAGFVEFMALFHFFLQKNNVFLVVFLNF